MIPEFMKGMSNFIMSTFGSPSWMSLFSVAVLCLIGFAKSCVFTQSIIQMITWVSGNALPSSKGSGITDQDLQKIQQDMVPPWLLSFTNNQTCELVMSG